MKIGSVHSKKISRRRQENAIFLFQTNFWSNLDKFLSETGEICPYWIKSWSKTGKFVRIGPKVGLKQENCNFPLRTSEFFCRRPKNFFERRSALKSPVIVMGLYVAKKDASVSKNSIGVAALELLETTPISMMWLLQRNAIIVYSGVL